MKTIIKNELLILVPETPEETVALASWKAGYSGHAWALNQTTGTGVALRSLGMVEDACREPINITSKTIESELRLLSNFAATPFVLDEVPYASVEGFWQSLKFPKGSDRRRVAALVGSEAMHAGREVEYGETVTYQGEEHRVGTWEHWRLMELACRAKFTQHDEARAALLSTGERPLMHRMRRDSKTIPGVIMADIWMRIRRSLQRKVEEPVLEEE